MMPLQAPPIDLPPWGNSWVGIVIPGLTLLVSVGVSWWLYVHFGHDPSPASRTRQRHDEPTSPRLPR